MDLDRHVLMVDGFPLRRVDRFLGEEVDTEGMAGTLTFQVADTHADFFTEPAVALLIEQDLRPVAPGGRYAAWFPVTREDWTEALHWASRGVSSEETRRVRWLAQEAIDRHLRPWTRPDRRGWPDTFEPFRSLTVLGGLLASVRGMLRWAPGELADRLDALALRMGRTPRTP